MKRVKLIKARLEQGLSQHELAKACGLSDIAVVKLEQGRFPRPVNIQKLARGYGLTAKDFVEILYENPES